MSRMRTYERAKSPWRIQRTTLCVWACAAGCFASPSPELKALGEKLFFDKSLSTDATVACSSCHQPELAFTDGRRVAQGVNGQTGLRNTPTLLNVGTHTAYFWDGRSPTLEDQVLQPLLNPIEHGFRDLSQLLEKVNRSGAYRMLAKRAFPAGNATAMRSEDLAAALSAYVRTLKSAEGPIDRFVLKGQSNALSPAAKAGFTLFKGKAQCSACHSLSEEPGTGRVQLHDKQFHAHGRQVYPMQEFVRRQISMGMSKEDIGNQNAANASHFGRFMVTGLVEDVGSFKTPTLRNVARTAPYFHDGSAATLDEALDREVLGKASEVNLSAAERQALKAFLLELNDDLPKDAAADSKHRADGAQR